MKPLSWGQTQQQIKRIDSNLGCGAGYVSLQSTTLKNFPGDCGALILTGANSVSEETLRTLCKVASYGGFSKIFATVVLKDTIYSSIKDRLNVFRANNFIKVKHGKSNRNPYKDDIVFVKYISNCKYKGY